MNEQINVSVHVFTERERERKKCKDIHQTLGHDYFQGITIVGEEEAFTFCYINLYIDEV